MTSEIPDVVVRRIVSALLLVLEQAEPNTRKRLLGDVLKVVCQNCGEFREGDCQCGKSVIHMEEAADMLEFFFSMMQMHSPKMNGQHSYRFRGGWPMTHCVGPSAEEAVKAAIAEVKRSRLDSEKSQVGECQALPICPNLDNPPHGSVEQRKG